MTAIIKDFIPLTYQWKEETTEKMGGDRRIVTHKATELNSGDQYITRDSNDTLAAKFFVLILATIPFLMVRMPARAFLLISKSPLQAMQEAEIEWLTLCQAWIQAGANPAERPSESTHNLLIAQSVLIRTVIDIVKLVTLPLAAVAATFAALYGLTIDRLGGKRLYAKIEELWASSSLLSSVDSGEPRGFSGGLEIFYAGFLARCMQPTRAQDKFNIPYRNLLSYQIRPRLHFSVETLKNLQAIGVESKEWCEAQLQECEAQLQEIEEWKSPETFQKLSTEKAIELKRLVKSLFDHHQQKTYALLGGEKPELLDKAIAEDKSALNNLFKL